MRAKRLHLPSSPDDFYGAMRVGDDGLRDTAHDLPLEPRSSVRSNHDQVCLPFVCSVDDRCSRVALTNRRVDR